MSNFDELPEPEGPYKNTPRFATSALVALIGAGVALDPLAGEIVNNDPGNHVALRVIGGAVTAAVGVMFARGSQRTYTDDQIQDYYTPKLPLE